MPTVINSTGQVIEDQQARDIDMAEALLTHELHKRTESARTNQENYALKIRRIAEYKTRMDDLLDPLNAPWPPDGQPGDMGDRVRAMWNTPPIVRVFNGIRAKFSITNENQMTSEQIKNWIAGW